MPGAHRSFDTRPSASGWGLSCVQSQLDQPEPSYGSPRAKEPLLAKSHPVGLFARLAAGPKLLRLRCVAVGTAERCPLARACRPAGGLARPSSSASHQPASAIRPAHQHAIRPARQRQARMPSAPGWPPARPHLAQRQLAPSPARRWRWQAGRPEGQHELPPAGHRERYSGPQRGDGGAGNSSGWLRHCSPPAANQAG